MEESILARQEAEADRLAAHLSTSTEDPKNGCHECADAASGNYGLAAEDGIVFVEI
jgi:hypothetical protein